MNRGRLYLVPNLLGVVPPERVLPAETIALTRRLRYFVVENAKPARAFLKTLSPPTPIQDLRIVELGKEPSPPRCADLLAPARSGDDVGMLSDAGCPGIADPGAALVAEAHREGIRVVPLVGPSSIVLALMASGMNGQGFVFHGYLPAKTEQRSAAIRRLEDDSRRSGQTQIFIETPYRNAALLSALIGMCRPTTRLCVAADLTLDSENIVSQPIERWRGVDSTLYAKRPAIFLIQG